MSTTFGPTYEAAVDGDRIRTQMDVVKGFMLRATTWMTLAEIEDALEFPQASLSAQLRHLRKPRFGGYDVRKRRRSPGTWEYRVLPGEKTQPELPWEMEVRDGR